MDWQMGITFDFRTLWKKSQSRLVSWLWPAYI